MGIPIERFLVLSVILLCIGCYGLLARRNAIGILMSIEVLLNAVNINLVAFSRTVSPSEGTGQIFALFVIGMAAAAAVVGLALVLAISRHLKTVNLDEMNLLKW